MLAFWGIFAGLLVAAGVAAWSGRSAPRCTVAILAANWVVGNLINALSPGVPVGWLIVVDAASALAILLLMRERAQLLIAYIFMGMIGVSAVHWPGGIGDWEYITVLTAGEALQIALVTWEAIDGRRKAVRSGRGGGDYHGAVAARGVGAARGEP